MVKRAIIQTNKSIGHNFNGFNKSYPEDLYSSLPIKEHIEAIEFINANTKREYSSLLFYFIICVIFGLIPLFFIIIAELIKSSLYKNRFERDLKKSLEIVNKLLISRHVCFTYKFQGTIRKMSRLQLIITYPEQTVYPDTLGEIVVSQGRNVLVIQGAINPIEGHNQYKITNPYMDKELIGLNSNFKISKVPYIIAQEVKSSALKNDNFYGFQNEFDKDLYNFMLESEYQSMIREFNTVLIRKIDIKKQLIFVLISTILLVALIGFILIIPAMILYNKKRTLYYTKLHNDIGIMVNKYSSIYNSRGITISYKTDLKDFNDRSSPLINLLIIYPKAPIGSPLLTNFQSNTHQWVIVPSVHGGIEPYFTFCTHGNIGNHESTSTYQSDQNLNYNI